MLLTHVGSLPPFEGKKPYPYSHIEYWFGVQTEFGFDLIGTGEPGWSKKYGMIERFTQDLEGFEIETLGKKYRTYNKSKIIPPEDANEVKEVVENNYLRKIAGKEAKLKANITDPVSIVFGLGNFLEVYRGYPEIYWDLTKALKPVVKALSKIVDVIQFDCPSHAYNPTKDPWQYVDELAECVEGQKWIHICGPLKNIFSTLASRSEYKADVIHCHFFGKEEEENFKTIEEGYHEFERSGKKLGAGIINTAIQDIAERVDSAEIAVARIRRLERILKGRDNLATIGPGCGLTLLPNATPVILQRATEVARIIRIKKS